MKNAMTHVLTGNILEEETTVSLAEICINTHIPAEEVIRLIDYGIITPCRGGSARQWRFERSSLVRADKALRLRRDLGVNLAGAALALDLLDEMEQIRSQLCLLQNQSATGSN